MSVAGVGQIERVVGDEWEISRCNMTEGIVSDVHASVISGTIEYNEESPPTNRRAGAQALSIRPRRQIGPDEEGISYYDTTWPRVVRAHLGCFHRVVFVESKAEKEALPFVD